MDNEEKNERLGDASWGAGLLNGHDRTCTDATDTTSEGSDFTPEQVARMGRSISSHAVPLPEGVQDVQWQPPVLAGLGHSNPIFETISDNRGILRVSTKGLDTDNCHFRSWQEDNGVAATFASGKVEKVVDGQRMTVAIGSFASGKVEKEVGGRRITEVISRGSRREMVCRLSSSVAIQRTSIVHSETRADGPDFERLRALRRSSSEGEESLDSNLVLEEGGAAGPPSLPSTDAPTNQYIQSSTPRRPSEDAVSDLERNSCARKEERDGILPVEEVAAVSPSFSSTDAFNQNMPPMPQRPMDGVVSSHARQPRPGRSLFSKEEGGAEEVGHPSPAAAPGRGCEPADAGSEAGVGHPSSVIGPTSRAEVGGEEVTRVVGGPDSQQHQAGDTEGRHEGRKDLSGSTPSPKVEEKARKRWWGGSRTPRAPPSPQPTLQSKLLAVSLAAGNDTAPAEPRRWFSFRRHRQRVLGA